MEASSPGDVYEVTGFPAKEGQDAVRAAEKAAAELRSEAYYMGHRKDVAVSRRKGRVFLERKRPSMADMGTLPPYGG